MNQPAVELFLEACGGRSPPPLEVVHRDRGVIVRQQLPLPFALVGRDQNADLRLDGKEVSRRHAFLQLLAGRWWWVDLNSRMGTQPEGNPASALPQIDRQGIRICDYTIRLAPPTPALSQANGVESSEVSGGQTDENEPAAPVNPLATDSDDPSLLPRLALEFHGSSVGMRTWRMDRALALIGRSALCKVRLHSTKVSRVHCALVNTPFGLWIIDLLGREGTQVNGLSVRWGRLEPDDEIRIDQFRIQVRYLSPLPRTHVSLHLVEPASEEHGLTPLASSSGVWPQGMAAENPREQTIAPVELAVPMTGAESLLMPLVKQFSQMQQQMFEQFQQTLLMMAQMFGNVQKEQMTIIRQELAQIQELTRQLHSLPAEQAKSSPPPQPAAGPVRPPALVSPPSPSAKPITAAAKPDGGDVSPKYQEGDVHAWLSKRLAALQEERQSRWQKVLSLLTGK